MYKCEEAIYDYVVTKMIQKTTCNSRSPFNKASETLDETAILDY